MTVLGCICITAAIGAAGYVILYPDKAGLHYSRPRWHWKYRLRDIPPGHPEHPDRFSLGIPDGQAWDVIEAAYDAETEEDEW